MKNIQKIVVFCLFLFFFCELYLFILLPILIYRLCRLVAARKLAILLDLVNNIKRISNKKENTCTPRSLRMTLLSGLRAFVFS